MSVNKTIRESVIPTSEQIDVRYYVNEFEEIQIGRRQNFSALAFEGADSAPLCAKILRRIFRDYYNWTPVQILECLTAAEVQNRGFKALVDKLPCPPEIDRDTDMRFVAWYLYPSTRTVSNVDLVRYVYDRLLSREIVKFPKCYFDGAIGQERAIILFQIMMEKCLMGKFRNLEEAFEFFSSSAAKDFIDEHYLITPLKELYLSPLDYFYDSLGATQKDYKLYEKYVTEKKKGRGAFLRRETETKAKAEVEAEAECDDIFIVENGELLTDVCGMPVVKAEELEDLLLFAMEDNIDEERSFNEELIIDDSLFETDGTLEMLEDFISLECA